MTNFHDVRIPDFIAIHAYGGPVFNTYHISTVSGHEYRYITGLIRYKNILLKIAT
ncbi:hypothetical protein OCHUTO_0080 [Orientia chuto str. Dubai]|uniref:DUF2460 domain-containing protein n=1 Tax=Orientia chuto str. Dubai TaxID=1359168 RepID=A0A0F3MSE4_9RICK|nr:DUF2460 domain-containing protein [Candidatus Orientia mediorientalis]KJV57534.1 hypothetical protein OCHUTO_0080 [Orientia chuto str. Dubai]